MEKSIISILTVLILFGLYKLLGKFLPIDKKAYQTDKTVDELRKKYVKFDLLQFGLFAAFAIGFAFVLAELLAIVIDLRLSFLSDATMLVKPDTDTIFIISFFSGMLLAVLLVFLISKRILKHDWEEYLAYSNLKYKFNYVKSAKYVVKIITLTTGLFIIALLDYYAAFGQQGIELNNLLSLGANTYQYSDVVKIKEIEKLQAPNGDIINDPHFIIEFNDGAVWNSRDNGFADYDPNSQIINLVRSKTNLVLEKLEFDTK